MKKKTTAMTRKKTARRVERAKSKASAKRAALARMTPAAAARVKATALRFERNGQALVPGVEPLADLPGDSERTVQTITMTKGRMRAQRIAAQKAGFTAWTRWAIATLDQAAGLAPERAQ